MMASVVGTAAVVAQQLPADKVPASVRKSYQTKFPGDRAVEWKLKTDKNYEAEFNRSAKPKT